MKIKNIVFLMLTIICFCQKAGAMEFSEHKKQRNKEQSSAEEIHKILDEILQTEEAQKLIKMLDEKFNFENKKTNDQITRRSINKHSMLKKLLNFLKSFSCCC